MSAPTGPAAWWAVPEGEVCRALGAVPGRGLEDGEAAARLAAYGPNALPEREPVSRLALLLCQFKSVIVAALAVAAVAAFWLGERLDAAVILAILVLNATIGFVQEYRAERSLRALRCLADPESRVLRGGRLRRLRSAVLVPGDLVMLETGDKAPADGRLIEAVRFKALEAALTGESEPVDKQAAPAREDAPLAERASMAFMGTTVAAGQGVMVVTATGVSTELGAIAAMLARPSAERTPLQRRLDQLGRRMVAVCLGVVALVFVFGVAQGRPVWAMLLVALSLAVAAIPEGLPAVVTITLSAGVRVMAGRKALVRRLSSVETLGCVTVIATDKTGTLTLNRMAARRMWLPGAGFLDLPAAGLGFKRTVGSGSGPVRSGLPDEAAFILRIGALCNRARLEERDGGRAAVGDPTESALLLAAADAGVAVDGDVETVLDELPFESDRKRMSMIRRTNNGSMLYCKGAPDVLLGLAAFVYEHGRPAPLDEARRAAFQKAMTAMAGDALRVLAFGFKLWPEGARLNDSGENGLVLAGMIGLMDPPRPEAREAVAACLSAGIRPIMITGDHADTAAAVAAEVGLAPRGAPALSGADLDGMNDAELDAAVERVSVFARVTAGHKLRLLRALRRRGHVTAMTGDGANDAPALNEADIGVAMGLAGTDVAKEASDMVLLDDNFATLVAAVENGRGIYDNIRKFVHYLLSSNLAEIFTIALGMGFLARTPSGEAFVPLTAVQILWMNLVTDGLPAVALGFDPPGPGVMRRPPRRPGEAILSVVRLARLAGIGLLMAGGALAACAWGLRSSAAEAHSMTLTTLVLLQIVRVHMVRSAERIPASSNLWVIGAVAVSLSMQVVALYVPFVAGVFGLIPPSAGQWAVMSGCTAGVWAAVQLFQKTEPGTPGPGQSSI